jgi:hypothetical protein
MAKRRSTSKSRHRPDRTILAGSDRTCPIRDVDVATSHARFRWRRATPGAQPPDLDPHWSGGCGRRNVAGDRFRFNSGIAAEGS